MHLVCFYPYPTCVRTFFPAFLTTSVICYCFVLLFLKAVNNTYTVPDVLQTSRAAEGEWSLSPVVKSMATFDKHTMQCWIIAWPSVHGYISIREFKRQQGICTPVIHQTSCLRNVSISTVTSIGIAMHNMAGMGMAQVHVACAPLSMCT